ncbi:DKNYY domain-containing protein [Paraflavitalea sp. CAU 1676]|uniref:DKNYY domain-containing protein n=1 Tax=Paraflavitalea sp. CAU 1676 TaxID=3032598 RepID=UPI0023DC2F3A|nr:DKNYY domain-containing protein [Paraflavitalea sp. CAU 1676]MDF2193478.1 DKNYY domain-containing protein [Paraflavitalea sp. CAU 1676]
MKPLIFLSILFCFAYCSGRNSDKQRESTSEAAKPPMQAVHAFGVIAIDTSLFTPLPCGLYLNDKGTLAFKAMDRSYRLDRDAGTQLIDVYITTVYYADLADSINGGQKEMRYVVDTPSFRIVGAFNCIDKYHVYNFNPMSDGGTISINHDADVNSFMILESDYFSKDNKHCYYRGSIIKGADLSSFKVLDTGYSHNIAYDKNNYYYLGEKMTAADVKEENLDSIRRSVTGL